MFACWYNNNRIGTCYGYCWTIIIAILSIIPTIAQEALQKQLEEAQLHIYKDPEKAVHITKDIYTQATEIDTKISTLITMVNGYTALNENETAMHYALEALKIAEQSKNVHYQIRTLGLLGEQFQLYHLNSISREYLKRAELLLNSPTLTSEIVAVSQGNIFAVKGNSYKDQIDCKYAIENYDKAIVAYKSISNHTGAQNNLALVYLEKGNCLLDLGDYYNAIENFKNAKEIASTNELNEYLLYAELGLAKIETKNQESREAIVRLSTLLQDSLFYNQELIKSQIFKLLKENYRDLNNVESFLEMQDNYAKSFDKIAKEEDANFEQILNFIHHTSPKTSKKISVLKIVIQVWIMVIAFILIYEILLFVRRKSVL